MSIVYLIHTQALWPVVARRDFFVMAVLYCYFAEEILIKKFKYPRVSDSSLPLAKELKDSGYKNEKRCDVITVAMVTQLLIKPTFCYNFN